MATVSIVDVAREAGLSVGTVSRAIRGLPNVRPTKVAAVKAAIARLGYQIPHADRRPGPRGPRQKKTAGSVAVIFASQSLKWIMNCAPVYAAVLHGIETTLAAQGFTLTLHQGSDWSRLTANSRLERPDGIILFGSSPAQEPAGALPKMPTVCAMGSPRYVRCDHVGVDHHRLGQLAAEYFLANGHRHCAYIGTGVDYLDNIIKARGAMFKGLIEEAGGTVTALTDPAIESANADTQWINESLLAKLLDGFVKLNPRPTAILLQADMYAASVYRQLAERGVRPQHDVAIVTCNNERPFLNGLRPAPAVIDLRAEVIGRRSVEQLLWRIGNPHEPPLRIMVEPALLEPDRLIPSAK